MGFKEGTGKLCVFFFSIAFSAMLATSMLSPSWLSVTSVDTSESTVFPDTVEANFGPFYGQVRTCKSTGCLPWVTKSVNIEDCSTLEDGNVELCDHFVTWRAIAIICFIIGLGTQFFIFAGCCCQSLTCGCCGNSLSFIGMLGYWVVALLSIISWSFVISSVAIMRDDGIEVAYMWGYWLFVAAATALGAICGTLADWASEDSWLSGIFGCIGKILCCCRGGED
mmetsp:Transcript_46771/g.69180  ORF Transcript_46771/g.69180 Transcript_46771/m.69180 type:complete len:224 (-) Transcript_46771:109-780(-)